MQPNPASLPAGPLTEQRECVCSCTAMSRSVVPGELKEAKRINWRPERRAGGTGERVVREPRVPRGPARAAFADANAAQGGEGAASAQLRARDRTRTPRDASVGPGKKKPGHPRGAGSARAIGRTGQRAGRPGPDGVNQLHPVVSPQFSHLWQVPLRTVSHPQRGQGGASGVELSRR